MLCREIRILALDQIGQIRLRGRASGGCGISDLALTSSNTTSSTTFMNSDAERCKIGVRVVAATVAMMSM